MNLPDKINKTYFIDLDKIKGKWTVRVSSDEPRIKEKIYVLPSWLSDEIDMKIDSAVKFAIADRLDMIKKALELK